MANSGETMATHRSGNELIPSVKLKYSSNRLKYVKGM